MGEGALDTSPFSEHMPDACVQKRERCQGVGFKKNYTTEPVRADVAGKRLPSNT